MTAKLERFLENPFTGDLIVKTKKKHERINVHSGVLGGNEDVYVKESTGEVLQTTVTKYKQVDEEEFVKIFAKNIALTFDLTSAGIKTFNLLMWCVQYYAINKDIVQLDEITLDEFVKHNKTKTLAKTTLYRGITELVKTKIIARHRKQGFYFINPSFCFNGNRIVFVNAIEKKKKKDNDTEDQLEIGLGGVTA